MFHFHTKIFSISKQFYLAVRNTCNDHLAEWLLNGDQQFVKWFRNDYRAYMYARVYEMDNEQGHSKHFQVVQLGACLGPAHYTTPHDNSVFFTSLGNHLQHALTCICATVVLVVDPFLSIQTDTRKRLLVLQTSS